MGERKAGRELDALVAEKVMGVETMQKLYPSMMAKGGAWLPHFSTDIAAAWEVVEKMRREGYIFDIEIRKDYVGVNCEHCESAPLAICLAALRAVGVPHE